MHIGGTPLTRQLEAFRAGMLARLPPADRQAILQAAEDLRANCDGCKSADVGTRAPDFALPDHHGRVVRLADLLAHGPVVVLFIRGGWCPFCTLTLRAYQDALPAMQAAGAQLIAISPQQGGSCSAVAERDLLAFPVLSDQGNEIAGRYGVAYELAPALQRLYARLGHDLPRINRTGDWRAPLPATFIIDPDGLIVRAHVEPVAHRRLEPAEVVVGLQRLAAETPLIDA